MSGGLQIVLGAVLLALGRKLFWLLVAGAGFVAGIIVTPLLLPGQPQWVTVAVAAALAVIGAVLALTLQKVAIGVVGFIAGGWSALWLLRALALDPGGLQWVAVIAGGVLGALLLAALFQWGLILLSSLAGAYLVVTGMAGLIPLPENLIPGIFLVVFGVGVIIQARVLGRG